MTTQPITVQPFHTYHEYVQGMNLACIMRFRSKMIGLSDNDLAELNYLEERVKVSTPMYNKFFNKNK